MGWPDRIRVLVSGRYMVKTRTAVECQSRRVESKSVGYALPPAPSKPSSTESKLHLAVAAALTFIAYLPPHNWYDFIIGVIALIQLLAWSRTR